MNSALSKQEIFRNGSRTYSTSARFFPEQVRQKVADFYAFVRIADSFVDSVPQQEADFLEFRQNFERCRAQEVQSGDPVIDGFVELCRELKAPDEWADAFLDAMAMDLVKSEYNSLEETLAYVYGSAEVIGLFMCRILGLSENLYSQARMLGRSMQYINFIRDLDEDSGLGRRYLPLGDSGLSGLAREDRDQNPEGFDRYLRGELDRFRSWQEEAERGFREIPRKYRIPIKTASDMYLWTARKLHRNPAIVFERKLKPPKWRILIQGLLNGIRER